MTTVRHSLGIICELLLIIGGINWGLIGLSNMNIVNQLLVNFPIIERSIYILVGLASIYILWRFLQKELHYKI